MKELWATFKKSYIEDPDPFNLGCYIAVFCLCCCGGGGYGIVYAIIKIIEAIKN